MSVSNAYPTPPENRVKSLPDPVDPRDPAGMCSCEARVETGPSGQILVLCIAGEIDMFTLPLVRAALTAALDQAPRDLVVDLAGVSFCCVRGFALLAATAHAASGRGIGYAFSGLNPHHNRVVTLLWVDGWSALVRYRSAAAAVTAIRVDQTYRDR